MLWVLWDFNNPTSSFNKFNVSSSFIKYVQSFQREIMLVFIILICFSIFLSIIIIHYNVECQGYSKLKDFMFLVLISLCVEFVAELIAAALPS